MFDLPDSHPANGPLMSGPQRAPRRSAARLEQKLAALRLALVQAKRQFHEESAREQSIREGTVGRAVWALIEQGRLAPSVIALIRDEVRPALSPRRAGAFVGTIFEVPTTPAEEVDWNGREGGWVGNTTETLLAFGARVKKPELVRAGEDPGAPSEVSQCPLFSDVEAIVTSVEEGHAATTAQEEGLNAAARLQSSFGFPLRRPAVT